jgi:nucleoside-diphosphate-sugar epimerase
LTVALWKILLCAKPGEVYNVGSDCDAVSIEELANKVAAMMPLKVKVLIEGAGKADPLRPRYVPDITKIKNDLEYTLHYDLDTSLARTVNHIMQESRQINLGLGKK